MTVKGLDGDKLTIGRGAGGVIETGSAFMRKRVGQPYNFICHSIAVCAQSPQWAEKEMCSSALSGWVF